MPIAASVEIKGLKEALRELSSIDKELAKDIRKDYRTLMKPVVADLRASIPEMPLSGMEYKWNTKSGFKMFPWDPALARKRAVAFTSTKKPKRYQDKTYNLATFGITWKGVVPTVIEFTGKGRPRSRQGINMARELTAKYGKPARFVYPVVDRHEEKIKKDMAHIVARIERGVGRKLS
jgi:hypothetical protein